MEDTADMQVEVSRNVSRLGRLVWPPRAAESKGAAKWIFQKKKCYFLRSS